MHKRPWLLRGFVVWLLIALAEMLHGTVRTLYLRPIVGDLASRQIGVLTGSIIIFLIAYATVRWIAAQGTKQLLEVGALWLILMVTFEVAVGRAFNLSWERILSDYLPWKGGFMVLGLAFLALSPLLVTHLRSRRRGTA
jgi:hypothetical protein